MKPVKPSIGGQAVIEGVMMRSPKHTAIALRKDDEIIVKKERNRSISDKYKFLKLPILRGMVALVEMLILGIRVLSYSADIQSNEKEEQLSNKDIIVAIVGALGFAIFLFIVIPTSAARFFAKGIKSPLLLNFVEGLFRIFVFLIYIMAISNMDDIRRVFQYHGAEHKTVNCYENNEELTVENVKKYTTIHSRCGTSFLMVVMFVSIILYSFLGWPNFFVRIASRIVLMPVVAGISYELIRLAGKGRFCLINYLSLPGMWLQKFTTKEPDDDQILVAIEALKNVL